MKMQDSTAITIARAHIDAWSHHDWEKVRELLAPNIHVVAITTQPTLTIEEFTGIDNYMERLIKSVQLIEPGSVQVISAIGDESKALILETLRIGLGPGGTMVTLARTSLCLLDENKKIKEEGIEILRPFTIARRGTNKTFCIKNHAD